MSLWNPVMLTGTMNFEAGNTPGRPQCPETLHARNGILKKFAVLVGLALLALLIDGMLTYDIFDARPETLKLWLVLALIVILGLIVVVADTSKNNDQNNSR